MDRREGLHESFRRELEDRGVRLHESVVDALVDTAVRVLDYRLVGTHCEHWWNGGRCCRCESDPVPVVDIVTFKLALANSGTGFEPPSSLAQFTPMCPGWPTTHRPGLTRAILTELGPGPGRDR